MPVSSRRAAVPRLREVIAAYRAEHATLEQGARNLLARLQQSDAAAKAFARLMRGAADFERILQKGPPYPSDVQISPPRCNYTLQHKAAELLTICIEAESNARAFRLENAKAKTMSARADRLDKAVAKLDAQLRKFVADVAEAYVLAGQTLAGTPQQPSLPHDAPPVSIFERPSVDLHSVDLQHAFDAIARWLAWGKGIADAEIARLGATRKHKDEGAATQYAATGTSAQLRRE